MIRSGNPALKESTFLDLGTGSVVSREGGTMKLCHGDAHIQVISTQAPLARALLGKCEGDEVVLQIGAVRQYLEVVRVE